MEQPSHRRGLSSCYLTTDPHCSQVRQARIREPSVWPTVTQACGKLRSVGKRRSAAERMASDRLVPSWTQSPQF
jgi:hypothetical protein